MIPARQSTALETAIGPVLDADGVAVTDCVVGDFKIKKTTGNFAALNGSATLTHVSAGMYDLVLTTSDTDTVGLNCIAIDDTVNACLPLYLQVMEEAVYDAIYAASAVGYVANQPVDVNTIKTQTVTCAAGVTVLASVGTAATSTAQTGDSYALANGASGFVAIKTQTAAIETDTQDLQTRVPSSAAATNMTTVFATDFATNYDTTEDRWAVLTRKIYDSNGFGYFEIQGGSDGTINVNNFGASALQQISEQVWDAAITSHNVAGSYGPLVETISTELAKVPKSDNNVTWNATAAAQIQSEATDALNAYDPPTNAEMEARTLVSAGYATPTNITAASGVVLASNGLDSISTTRPSTVAANFREMFVQLYWRFFGKVTKSATEIKNFAANGSTVVTTQAISSSGDDESQGAAT